MKRIILLLNILALNVYAEFTPEQYLKTELEAQGLSLEIKKEHLQCAQRACPDSEHFSIDEKYQYQLNKLYNEYGTTPAKAVVYSIKNNKKIEAYLKTHPQFQERLENKSKAYEKVRQNIKMYKADK